MRTNRSPLLVGLILLAAPVAGRCAGSASAVFLREEPTARSFALGGASAALYDEAGPAYFNPAGLGFMGEHRLTLSTWKGLDEQSRYNFISGIVSAGKLGGFGLTYLSYDTGSEEINELNGTTRNVTLEKDYALGLGWGHKVLGELLSVGGQVKRISSKLAESYSANTMTMDFGVLGKTRGGMFSAGAGLQNAFGNLTYVSESSPLPRVYYAGGAARIPVDGLGRLLIAADLQKPTDDSVDVRVGVEYAVNIVAVRMGGKHVSGDNSYTVGGGLKLKWLTFDYGFEPAGDLANPTHKFTLSAAFGGPKAKPAKAAAEPVPAAPAPAVQAAAPVAAPVEAVPAPAPAPVEAAPADAAVQPAAPAPAPQAEMPAMP